MKDALSFNTTFIAPRDPFLSSVHEEISTPVSQLLSCPRCKEKLDLSQPDVNRSDALLGVCGICPAWYYIDGRTGAVTDLGLADRFDKS